MNYRKNSKVLETYLNENGVIRFNLNSPENLNALSENMMDLMQNALDNASNNKNDQIQYKVCQVSTWKFEKNLIFGCALFIY